MSSLASSELSSRLTRIVVPRLDRGIQRVHNDPQLLDTAVKPRYDMEFGVI